MKVLEVNPMSFEYDGNVIGRLSYFAASVESSLYRNGKVFTHRDRNGNDDAYHGAVMELRHIVINDARRLEYSRRRQLEVHVLSSSIALCSAPIYTSSITGRLSTSTTQSAPRS